MKNLLDMYSQPRPGPVGHPISPPKPTESVNRHRTLQPPRCGAVAGLRSSRTPPGSTLCPRLSILPVPVTQTGPTVACQHVPPRSERKARSPDAMQLPLQTQTQTQRRYAATTVANKRKCKQSMQEDTKRLARGVEPAGNYKVRSGLEPRMQWTERGRRRRHMATVSTHFQPHEILHSEFVHRSESAILGVWRWRQR